MREINVGTKKYTKVVALDERGAGNANHYYEVQPVNLERDQNLVLGRISFQNGPIGENGVNGLANEDLLAIVIDRLEGFQAGEYASDDNKQALGYLRSALGALRHRTDEREARGVEGTSEA